MTAERAAASRRSRTRLGRGLREFVYGMLGYDFSRHALETRAALQTLFMVSTVGDMIGIPIMPPYYSMRLLPYVMPEVSSWKRRVLRERDLSEKHEFDLHGL